MTITSPGISLGEFGAKNLVLDLSLSSMTSLCGGSFLNPILQTNLRKLMNRMTPQALQPRTNNNSKNLSREGRASVL